MRLIVDDYPGKLLRNHFFHINNHCKPSGPLNIWLATDNLVGFETIISHFLPRCSTEWINQGITGGWKKKNEEKSIPWRYNMKLIKIGKNNGPRNSYRANISEKEGSFNQEPWMLEHIIGSTCFKMHSAVQQTASRKRTIGLPTEALNAVPFGDFVRLSP